MTRGEVTLLEFLVFEALVDDGMPEGEAAAEAQEIAESLEEA